MLTEKTEAYNIISFTCFLIVAVPILLLLYLGAETGVAGNYPGMVRLEVGKLYVKNKTLAAQDAQHQAIHIAESLNRHVAELAIQSPGNEYKLKNSSPELIGRTIEALSANPPRELLAKASNRSVRWAPNIGNSGLFILAYERGPSEPQSFGAIDMPGGKEKSTFLTEKKANRLLHEIRRTQKEGTLTKNISTKELVESALRTRPPLINPQEAVELLGLCHGLNITYNENLGLFLNDETIKDMITWVKELQ
jgi:hypothetical protein